MEMDGKEVIADYTRTDSTAPEVMPSRLSSADKFPAEQHRPYGISNYSERPPTPEKWHPLNNQTRRSTFISGLLLGVLIATITTSAILGGVLGSQLAQSRPATNVNQTCSTVTLSPNGTNTTSSTPLENYQPVRGSMVKSVPHDFDSTNPFQNTAGHKFQLFPGADFNTKRQAAEGGIFIDVIGLIAYSLVDCLDACSQMNHLAGAFNTPSESRCRSVAFAWNMSAYVSHQGANCYLKNGTLANGVGPYPVSTVISAKLLP